MKFAALAPISLLETTRGFDYHLALPLFHDNVYSQHFQEMSSRGDYIILDNGVAEGMHVDWAVLHGFADEIGAKEIVFPDVMGNREETEKKIVEAIKHPCFHPDKFRYMAVAQGSSMDDFKDCVNNYVAFAPEIRVIGIPRHMLETCKNSQARVGLAEWIVSEFDDAFKIHFLGMDAKCPEEARFIGQAFSSYTHPMIRGIDTSLPYNYAWHGLEARQGAGKFNPKRPDNYFNLPSSEFPKYLIHFNLARIVNALQGII